MAADWEEVKKLAFDFQKTQQLTSAQKLSERNCIDIVKRLIEKKLIDVIFTNDGKEYLTSDQLLREIEYELYSSGGRIDISDLVSILNVDYDHIEAKANHISRNSSGEVNIVLGQLISSDYKDNLATEIDLHLQESGSLAISELSKQYNLPAEFIMNLVFERLNFLIKGRLDKHSRIIYTHDYLARYESKIVGILSAITRPIALQTIVNRFNVAEKILNDTLNDLLSRKRILGSISGPTYIPEIYSKTQLEYVNNFYKHNRYLDYSTLSKLGVSNPESFLRKKFGDKLCYLNSCAVEQMLNIQIETTVEDCIQNNTFVDLIEIIPSILNPDDIDLLVKSALEPNSNLSSATIILCDTIVVSNTFIEKTKGFFDDIIQKKLQDDLKSGVLLNYFSKMKASVKHLTGDEKKSKNVETVFSSGSNKKSKKSGGGGSGSQGREVKTKAVKKKYKGGKHEPNFKNDEEDRENVALEFMSTDEICKVLTKNINSDTNSEEASEEFIEALAQHISDNLQKLYESHAKELFITHSTEAAKNKMSFADVQKSVQLAYSLVFLYNKGLQVFSSDDLKSKLIKHLQKTVCSDVVNLLLSYFTEDNVGENATPETRAKLIAKLDLEMKDDFVKLNSSLNTATIEDFLTELEKFSSTVDIMLKKVDKKQEKLLLSEQKQSLILKLSECQDPILGLHISTMLTFQVINDCILHASGKFVPQILAYLQKDLDADLYTKFKDSHDLVLQYISVSSSNNELDKNDLLFKLNQSFQSYKNIVIEYKKKLPAKE